MAQDAMRSIRRTRIIATSHNEITLFIQKEKPSDVTGRALKIVVSRLYLEGRLIQ